MNTKELILKIFQKIEKEPLNYSYYEDSFALIRDLGNDDIESACELSQKLRMYCDKCIMTSDNLVTELYLLSEKTLLFESPYLFDSYLIYVEKDRPASKKFYLPRRKQLKVVVDALQELVNDKLDELFIEMPPRVGKTTLLLFFVTWIVGKNSENSNLYSAYSDTITQAFYNGALEIINDPTTYAWNNVFANSKLARTNAKEEFLDIDRDKRYHSLTCRSLYGTLNGACDCDGYLISDDLIGGIEEALNKDRMISAWSKVDNNLIPRAKEKAKLLWCGTRWSLIDPAGRRMDTLQNDEKFKNRRFKIIKMSALDPITDESNFHYKYDVGFSTQHYHQRRASYERNNDLASWLAQYMQEPIERDGALFTPETMRYFNGILPSGEPDRIFSHVDVAWGGGDFVSMPIAYQYEGVLYVQDVVFDNGDKYITRPRVVNKILKHKLEACQFEANNGGEEYKEHIETELTKAGYRLNITSKLAPTTKRKEQRIFDKAPEIREIYFLEQGKRDKDYSLFMTNLFSFNIMGKNKNDDAPDSLAGLIDMINHGSARHEVFQRPI